MNRYLVVAGACPSGNQYNNTDSLILLLASLKQQQQNVQMNTVLETMMACKSKTVTSDKYTSFIKKWPRACTTLPHNQHHSVFLTMPGVGDFKATQHRARQGSVRLENDKCFSQNTNSNRHNPGSFSFLYCRWNPGPGVLGNGFPLSWTPSFL